MMHWTLAITALLLVATFRLPLADGVIFRKGSEQYYNNGYVDISTPSMQRECIDWHNYVRALHGVAPLVYSPKLEKYARRRAAELAQKDGTNFYHPDDLPYGENLAWNSEEPIDCRVPLQLWYDEWKIYNFRRPNLTPQNGHFTQMVWKESTQIGCGQAISHGKHGGTYTVCNYDPPGNWADEELDNVLPPSQYVEFDPMKQVRKNKKVKVYYPPTHNSESSHGVQIAALSKPSSVTSSQSYYHKQPSTNTYNKWSSFRPHSNKYNYQYNSIYKRSYNQPTYKSQARRGFW